MAILVARARQDGFALAATPINISAVNLPLLKHIKGALVIHGGSGGTLPLGTRFVVHDLMQGWARLEKGKPARRVAREAGKPFPERNELGDLDSAKWPIGFNGEPNDPWNMVAELYLTCLSDGRDLIFTTNNVTGRTAVEEFARGVVWQRMEKSPNAKPIVEIGSRTYLGQFGPVAVPTFSITGWWDSGAEEDQEPQPIPVTGLPARPRRTTRPKPITVTTAEELDDEIPF